VIIVKVSDPKIAAALKMKTYPKELKIPITFNLKSRSKASNLTKSSKTFTYTIDFITITIRIIKKPYLLQ
jgi:hypothetical protein